MFLHQQRYKKHGRRDENATRGHQLPQVTPLGSEADQANRQCEGILLANDQRKKKFVPGQREAENCRGDDPGQGSWNHDFPDDSHAMRPVDHRRLLDFERDGINEPLHHPHGVRQHDGHIDQDQRRSGV